MFEIRDELIKTFGRMLRFGSIQLANNTKTGFLLLLVDTLVDETTEEFMPYQKTVGRGFMKGNDGFRSGVGEGTARTEYRKSTVWQSWSQ